MTDGKAQMIFNRLIYGQEHSYIFTRLMRKGYLESR